MTSTSTTNARRIAVRGLTLGVALAALAACGGGENAAADSAAAASSPDSAGLQTTPPQPNGPMNMIDSGTKAPTTGDSAPATVPIDTGERGAAKQP